MSGKAVRNSKFTFRYGHLETICNVWFTGKDIDIQNVIFLGTVQVGKLPYWVAQHCPPGTAVIQGAPHWLAAADGSTIPDFMLAFTKQSFDHIAQEAQVKHVHVLADSQAAPGVLRLFGDSDYIGYLDKMTLIQPLGLNNNAFTSGEKPPIAVFNKRVRKNTRFQILALLLEHRIRYNHYLIARTTSADTPKAFAQYAAGLRCDATPDLARLYSRNPNITILCGANDKLFPAQEIANNLAAAGLPITPTVVTGVPHSPLATRYGRKLLAAAFAI